jgi:N-acetylglucosamine kinase-like BadF-type ATPase
MIVGIDIGGTKTHLAVKTADGTRRDRVLATASWRFRRDQSADAAGLCDILLEMTGGQPDACVVGSHGCDTDADCLALQKLMSLRLSEVVLVLNDSELLPPAAGKNQGIAVIAGTGSIAVSRGSDRKMRAAGGWGWFLGDEGSACGLVREAARAVRRSLDQGNALDQLGQLLMDALGVASPVELGRALLELGSAARVGSLAHLVFEAADAGSRSASKVIADGGDALAVLVGELVDRGAVGTDVITAGGVISRQSRLLGAFREALALRVPGATLELLQTPPVTGALLLAETLASGQRPGSLPLPHVGGRRETNENGRAA